MGVSFESSGICTKDGLLPPLSVRWPRPRLSIHCSVCYLLTALVLVLAYCRRSVFEKHDPYKCHATLSHGQWLHSSTTTRPAAPSEKWLPEGCMLRSYDAKGISTCLGSGVGNDAVFIGDSTVREVFWAVARKLDAVAAETQAKQLVDKHSDIHFAKGTTSLDFVWDPFLNSSQLFRYVDSSRSNAAEPWRVELPNSKALVVVGGGLWFAREQHGGFEFQKSLDKIVTRPKQLLLIDLHAVPGSSRVYYLPVQPPQYHQLDEEHRASLKEQDIESLNKYMRDLPVLHDIDLLSSFLDMVNGHPNAYQMNGLHVLRSVADEQAEVILNLRCNNAYRGYPYTGTCCFEYPTRFSQLMFITLGFVGLCFVLWLELKDRCLRSKLAQRFEPAKKHLPLLRPFLILWAALCYCWLADRTHLFDKVAKNYNVVDFSLFFIAVVITGLVTIKSSASMRASSDEKLETTDQPLLSRDQTDEWKGWMQLLILAYHYTGASKILWIYKMIRLLVASYLFMTGYGHAAFFYQKKDFSLKRIVAVNLRLNILSCLLPWMMDSDYLFYYFAPLVTYWYFVVYITMRVKSDWNTNLALFLLKVSVACAITTIIHSKTFVFDSAFTIINTLFGSKWDAQEWLFRCGLDQFIVYIGMIVAVLYIRSCQPPCPEPPPQDSLTTTSHNRSGAHPGLRKYIFYAADAVALLIYTSVSSMRVTKEASNVLHPYVSPLAVLAFVHLRNATPTLRNYFSNAFAWIGRISLETFILQYHIWLAADTKGLLSLGVLGRGAMDKGRNTLGSGMGFVRWTDCIILGVVFVWVSHKVARATGAICTAILNVLFPADRSKA